MLLSYLSKNNVEGVKPSITCSMWYLCLKLGCCGHKKLHRLIEIITIVALCMLQLL